MKRKKEHLYKKTGRIFLWISLLLVLGISCQQDEAFFDQVSESLPEVTLKSNGPENYTLEGTYQGSIWRITLPPSAPAISSKNMRTQVK
jgi:hypothetical protein